MTRGAGQPRKDLASKDAPLQAAIQRMGGQKPFFRALGLRGQPAWTRVPQGRVFQVSDLCDMAPETLRPDLADWIASERARHAEQAERFAQIGEAVDRRATAALPQTLLDLWSTMTAIQFVASSKGLRVWQVCGGQARQEQAARAYAMALAKVVGRASSTTIAAIFGCARQNVDNATERYIRARDGDDPEDYLDGLEEPRVWEASRLRRPKQGSDALWAAEQRYAALLRGETFTPREERKRA